MTQYFPDSDKPRYIKRFLFFLFVIIFLVVVLLVYKPPKKKNPYANIQTFEDCKAAGYPITRSTYSICTLPNGTTFFGNYAQDLKHPQTVPNDR